MSLNKNDTWQEESATKQDSSARTRLIFVLFFFSLLAMCLYLWDIDQADSDIADLSVTKPLHVASTSSLRSQPMPTPASSPADFASDASNTAAENPTPTAGQRTTSPAKGGDVIASDAPNTAENPTSAEQEIPSSSGVGDYFDTSCSDVCTAREASRKQKFGGDLLDFQEIFRLADKAHKEVQSRLRNDYGEYFEIIFVNGTNEDGGTHYRGMNPPDSDGPSPSRERMKRKMKLKVLKMMASVKESESSVHGCDCIGKKGSVNMGVDNDVLTTIPDFYEKYVFANGGHSNAAGHGNMFSEAYTAVFGRDVRPIWEAIGIQMIDRNYAMGAMRATPFMSCCSKEVFGRDVDFLAWNYGMTDGKAEACAHYIYRGAMIPSHPALVTVDATKIGRRITKEFEALGLAMFDSLIGLVSGLVPNMAPDDIPISDEEAKKIPEIVRYLKCNRRMEGKELCFRNKWSCTGDMLEAGIDCICAGVGKRVSWHMGYRMHALQGHLLGLPFIEMLLEALKELANARISDHEQLLTDLQTEEDNAFKQFMESPLLTDILGDKYDTLGKPTDPLYETWFRGHSICRTAFLPSQSRYLGLMTESNKTGDVAIYTHETYDDGDFYYSGRQGDGEFVFVGNETPPAGKFSIIAWTRERSGYNNITAWEKECPAVVMPDYKDSFYAPLLDGKASITFPNQKEKEHYGYVPKLFKGVVAVVLAMSEKCKKCPHAYDLTFEDFLGGSASIQVNSKPVKKIRMVSENCMILEGDNGNLFWEPNPETEDYTIEFQVSPQAAIYQLRVANIIVM